MPLKLIVHRSILMLLYQHVCNTLSSHSFQCYFYQLVAFGAPDEREREEKKQEKMPTKLTNYSSLKRCNVKRKRANHEKEKFIEIVIIEANA